tara:strand:+ start:2607 stop:3368 length:762 start_codon:yes stop_codon:yes gene_type:complete
MRFLVLLICFVIFEIQSQAFGRTGHRVVAEIASRNMLPSALHEAHRLLNGRSLAMVANWADEIRDHEEWKHSFWWHFVNVEDQESYKTATKNPNGDIYQSILRFQKVLSLSSSDAEKSEALKWLIHLIGDLHQPLHVGKSDDQGGNKVQVNWMGIPTNLHRVWDEHLVSTQQLSFTEMSDFLNFYDRQEIRQWQSDEVIVWLQESYELRKQAYKIGNRSLSYAYYGRCVPIVNRRLRQAGIRLAAVLNRILAP